MSTMRKLAGIGAALTLGACVITFATSLGAAAQGATRPRVVASASPAACSASKGATVSSAAQLASALAAAKPGSVIVLAPGTYRGSFTASGSGTATSPITLCGPRTAVLTGGGMASGYVLHLSGVNWWQLYGFSVQDAQKGVVLDHSGHNIVDSLSVHMTGDEAIHLRAFSSDNTVSNNTIRDTGHLKAEAGEGIYVGSANKFWCTYTSCKPDQSDRNVLRANTISNTTAENIDIKEGTTGGLIDGNHLSGVGMIRVDASAWINVKGNSWTVQNNTGTTSPQDGYTDHQVYPGWGLHNVFKANKATVNASGYGYFVAPHGASAIVYCSNTATGAKSGLTNIACTPGG